MTAMEETRLDKFLWAVRFYKTRRLAVDACQGNHVKVNDAPAKPSRTVRIGDVLEIRLPDIVRTVKILALTERRVGAKLVDDHLEDLTPETEYKRREERQSNQEGLRPRGLGRPTKKERREIDRFRGG